LLFFFSSRRRHTRSKRDWSSDVCSSDLVFYKKLPTHNPQMTKGTPYIQKSGKASSNYNPQERVTTVNEGYRYPLTVQRFNNERGLHPTQKPVTLFEYLIKTYTNEGEPVLDNCMGSGTTAIAAINTNRNYLGFELDEKYFELANDRIEKHNKQMELFEKQE